jgi:putative glutamine amidotransferase
MKPRVAVTFGDVDEKLNEKALRYARAAEAAGMEPIIVTPPNERSLAGIGASGLLLAGGTDVDPELYGEERAPESDVPDQARDQMERRLLGEALERDLPVLGICRGLQFLNVYHGGSLFQHHAQQSAHRVYTEDRSLPAHEVEVAGGTRLAGILGTGAWPVNSRHHQAAHRVAERLVVSARAPDGMVEGLERMDKSFVIGVQWHPEDMQNDARQRSLFEALRKAAEGR